MIKRWIVGFRDKLFGIDKLEYRLRNQQSYYFRELKAIEILKPYFPEGYLFESGFSLSFQTIQHIVNDIIVFKPKIVLEFGSGLSTIILNNFIKQNDLEVKLISIDDNFSWQKSLKDQCDVVDFFDFPLTPDHPFSFEGKGSWYNIPEAHPLNKLEYDLIIVDAPKGSLGKLSRYGFVNFLAGKLSDKGIVYVDDTHRDDEHRISDLYLSRASEKTCAKKFYNYTRFSRDQTYYTCPS